MFVCEFLCLFVFMVVCEGILLSLLDQVQTDLGNVTKTSISLLGVCLYVWVWVVMFE